MSKTAKDYRDVISTAEVQYEEDFLELQEDEFEEKTGSRTRGERRKKDFRKANRKKRIAREINGQEYYDSLHRYSKNKINRSQQEEENFVTLRDGTRRPKQKKGYKPADMRKIDMLNSQEGAKDYT